MFLKRSDPNRYGAFLTELQNSAHLNRDEYPESEVAALELMVRRSGVFNSSLTQQAGRNGTRNGFRRHGCGRGYNFVQNSGRSGARPPAGTVLVAGSDGRTCNVLCYRCQTWGHYADHCPESGNRQGTNLVQFGYNFNQGQSGIPREWVLLDTCSTNNVFNNCGMLGDIISCDLAEDLEMKGNGGCMTYCLKSTMMLFPLSAHYNEKSIGNILSFFDLVRVPRLVITFDSRENYGFNVTYLVKMYHFLPYENGLYYYDTRVEPRSVTDKTKEVVNPYSFLP